MTAYHPDVEMFEFTRGRRERFRLSSKAEIRKFLQIKQKTGCSLKELSTETDNFSDESKLWSAVVLFLDGRFRISFKFKDVYELLDVGLLCGLDPLVRLEMVADMLVAKSNASEKLVKVVILIFISKFYLYRYRVSNFRSWARAQAYSVNPLFDAYLFGIGDNLFFKESVYRKEIVGPIYFSGLSDRMICQFIIDSGVFCDQELDEMYTGGKYYSGGWSGSGGSIMYSKYKDYTDAVDENIFDREPLPRESIGF